MHVLVRSALRRGPVIDGKRVFIDPPKVREALELLVTHEGYRAGDVVDGAIFQDALRRWLPSDVADTYAHKDADPDVVVPFILALILEGLPESESDKSIKGKSQKNPFGNMVGLYAKTYGCDPWTVYSETPWPFFLLFVHETTRQNAVRQMSDMRTFTAQHMSKEDFAKFSREMNRALQLVSDAGMDETASAQMGLEMLQALKHEQNART